MATLTKNYVVLLDDKNMPSEERRKKKSPPISRRQLILLDYTLKEVKILDLDMEIYLIASDSRNDTVYLLVANPDFMLAKIELY